jgi:Tfp pilus assembly protein FimT
MLVVLVIAGILLGLAAVRLTEAADEAAVRAAAGDIAAAMSTARGVAIYRRAAVAVAIDTLAAALFVREDTSLLLKRDLRSSYSVSITASRDSTAFDARGLGVGAANLSVVVRRRNAIDTVFVSRLGRVRY